MTSVLLSQLPNYKGFKGTIEQVMDNQYMNSGEVSIIDSTTIEISELPVKSWTQVSHSCLVLPHSDVFKIFLCVYQYC